MEEYCISVKQGEVLSPVLFAVYMDGRLRQLKYSWVGFYISNYFVSAIAYADDLILICTTDRLLDILTGIAEVCLKFFIHNNETELLKQNNKYKINTFSMFSDKNVTLYIDMQ